MNKICLTSGLWILNIVPLNWLLFMNKLNNDINIVIDLNDTST